MTTKMLLTVFVLLSFNSAFAQSEVANSVGASGSDTVMNILDHLERQTMGNDLTCSYVKGNHAEAHDGNVMHECIPHNANREVSTLTNNKYCLIQKIQCYSLSTGHFEVENVKFYVNRDTSCKDIDPTTAFKDYVDWDSTVNFIGNH